MRDAVLAFLRGTHMGATGYVWLATLVGLPIANEIYQRLPTKGQSLLQGIAVNLLKAPLLGPTLVKFPLLGELLYIFSPTDREGLPKPISVVIADRMKKDTPAPAPVPVPALTPLTPSTKPEDGGAK